jgi:hypothetical protein
MRPVTATFLDRARDATQADDTRKALDNALRQLEKAKASREELVAAVYRAARDAAQTITIPPVRTPKAPKGKGSPEAAILTLADWQVGKRTPTYDSDVAAERVRRYGDLAVRLIAQNRAPVTEARIYLLGDLLEGELVFAGQAHRIDASLYRQVFNVAELLADLVRKVAAVVPYVRVVGVIGNHGELGGLFRKEYHPESNADAIAYNIARQHLTNLSNVEWVETVATDERAWHAFDEVQGRRWLLFHGNQVKPSMGFPWYGMQKALLGWYAALGPFSYAASGHWHQPVNWYVNSIRHFGAGSTESGNTYAQEWIKSGGQPPSQWLIFQGHKGIAAEHLLRLDESDEMAVAA